MQNKKKKGRDLGFFEPAVLTSHRLASSYTLKNYNKSYIYALLILSFFIYYFFY